MQIGIRPEHLHIAGSGLAVDDEGLRLKAVVTLVEQLGESHLVYVRSEEGFETFRRGIAVREKLNASDPRNTDWQYKLGQDYRTIGIALEKQQALARRARLLSEVRAPAR